MVILSTRTKAAYSYKTVTSESEWTTSQKTLGYLDLADHNGTLFDWYKREYRSRDDEAFQTHWIATSGKGFPVDDCRVLYEWFNGEGRSMFSHLSMKDREPDWMGRNLFLEYVKEKILKNPTYLESGEAAVRFMNFAERCGFALWRESEIDEECCIADYVFSRVYPSVLKGINNARVEHPQMAMNLWEMFCFTYENLFMLFEKMPDVQHLLLLLDVARQSGFDFWSIGKNIDAFSFLNVFVEYICQNRCNLIMTLLRYGMTFEVEPIYWFQSIYMGVWTSACDFTASPEVTEVFELTVMVHPHLYYPPPDIVRESLLAFYEDCREWSGLDADRGKKILYELVDAYASCGVSD